MILWILEKIFDVLIGNLPESRKKILWEKFTDLVSTAAFSGAKGISEGAIESLKEKHKHG